MPHSILLFVNGPLGLRVLDFLLKQKNIEILGIVINNDSKLGKTFENSLELLLSKSKFEKENIVKWSRDDTINLKNIKKLGDCDFGISVLFCHVIKSEILKLIPSGIINLHPSLLPNGRGNYPIPWSILENNMQGVTIHKIDEEIDTGPILASKEIATDISMNAGYIYSYAMDSLFQEFVNVFPHWVAGNVTYEKQLGVTGITHKSSDLEKLRVIHHDESLTAGQFFKRIQALTFSDGRLPKFQDSSGNIWSVELKIQKNQDG